MLSKVRSANTSPSPKHNFVMNPSFALLNIHIDQGERHRLFRASSSGPSVCWITQVTQCFEWCDFTTTMQCFPHCFDLVPIYSIPWQDVLNYVPVTQFTAEQYESGTSKQSNYVFRINGQF